MIDQITVPTFEQIETILLKLATNYSNLAILFSDTFFSKEPMEVTFQMYNEAGELETFTIPNLAMSLSNILSGEGSPQGQVEAGKGVIYQDLSNGDLYIKLLASGNVGWTKFVTDSEMETMLIEGLGNPEGVVLADKGTLYVDKTEAALYIKTQDNNTTDWVLISANTSNLADRDLSNLTTTGQAKFNVKENVSNKVTSVSVSSTNEKYPSAKAVYDFVNASIGNFADKDFSNITSVAENKFANKDLSNITSVAENKFVGINKLKDCIIEAPTLIDRGLDNSFTIPHGTVLLCANGLTAGHTLNNKVVTITQNKDGIIPSLPNESGYIFYDDTYGIIRTPASHAYFCQEEEPTVTAGGVWYNPEEYTYYVVGVIDNVDVWVQVAMVEIGKWTTNSGGLIDTFEAYKPVRLMSTESRELDHTIVEIGGTETNWYRLYKDGWIEAGGCGTGNTNLSFNKDFKTTNYTFVASGVTSYTKAVDGVTITAAGDFDWMAKGWSA